MLNCVSDYICMPELPEVESVLRTLRDCTPPITGRVINHVCLLLDSLVSGASPDKFRTALEGMKFSSIRRHGKYLIFSMTKAGTRFREMFLIVHLRMTGRLFLVPQEQAVEKHTRMSLLLDDGFALRFDDPRKFGRVWLVDDPAPVLSGLGPDALSLSQNAFSTSISTFRRQIKPLLLDQSFLAGIGNIYADEILFLSGIHPITSSGDLSDLDIERLYCTIQRVLTEAVEADGANIDGVFDAGRFVVNVYGRGGKPCINCGSAIVKIKVGQRGTHVCTFCQKFEVIDELHTNNLHESVA